MSLSVGDCDILNGEGIFLNLTFSDWIMKAMYGMNEVPYWLSSK